MKARSAKVWRSESINGSCPPQGTAENRGIQNSCRTSQLWRKLCTNGSQIPSDKPQIRKSEFSIELLQQISKLLQTNPEYYTMWNHRRLILRHIFSHSVKEDPNLAPGEKPAVDVQAVNALISDDLDFLFPLLRKFPKCYWIWSYRLWILGEATRLLPPSEARAYWQRELGLASKMLNLDNRNFHGWGYRRIAVEALESEKLSSEGKSGNLTEDEFAYTTKMIESNLSNFSAWHNRSKIIVKLLNERKADNGARKEFLDNGQ